MKYCLIALAILLSLSSFGQSHSKISDRLATAIKANPDAYQHISILLSDRFDIVKLDNELNARRASVKERIKLVETNLQQKAKQTQVEILKLLKSSDLVDQASVNSYWITNIIFCKVKAGMINQLAVRSDIELMDLNVQLKSSSFKKEFSLPLFASPDGAEPGLKVVNADKLWALGYSGYGRVAYVDDTGINPSHPAFVNKTRSLFVPKAQTWYDFQGGDTPYNCGDHGSHCLGTILGLDRIKNDTVGVAFNAQWIGGVVLCGVGTEDNLMGLEWSLDPDKNPNTIDDMPDVINNSWYDPDIEDDCVSAYVDVVAAIEAAGIACVFSAGNAGPDPQTITHPHNININLVNSFTVAAINGNVPSHIVADFSSRGPSKCGGTGSLLIKPEVAAPGVNVRSCSFNEDYVIYSGTSMASPHTCGTILLLKEAFPYLSGYDLKMALYNTCTDLGEPGEDNVYGMGLINGWAAYNYLISQGNVPVDPHKATDLILINVETKPYHCEGTLTAKAFIENAGAQTVTQFEIAFQVTDKSGNIQSYTNEWKGILLPGERIYYDIPAVTLNPGKSTILYDIVKVNNIDDERPLNNRVRKISVIVDNIIQTAGIVGGTTLSTCNGTQLLVQSSFTDPNGRVDWYDQNTGNKIGSGNPFLTPPSKDTTILLMQPVHFNEIGKKELTEVPVEVVSKPAGGLRFDADYPFILKSVKVYNTSKGFRKIQLYNSSFGKQNEKNVSLTQIGEQTIDLDFPVPQAQGQFLVLSQDSKGLALSTSGANYPYEIENIVTITGNIPPDIKDGYSYFYDWQIEYNDFCGKVEVAIPFINTSDTLIAGFAVADTSYIVPQSGAQVMFSDTSLNASTWNWDFGDGSVSIEQNPTHLYTNPGVYKVTQLVSNTTECYDTYIKNIVIEDKTATSDVSFNESYRLFPNPNKGSFSIRPIGKQNKELEISIYNSLGIEIKHLQYPGYVEDFKIDLTNQVPGFYWLRLVSDNKHYISTFVIE